MQAIQQSLGKAAQVSFEALQLHLVWAGDYALSALSDEALGLDFIWPHSLPPAACLPDEATLVARDAAAHANRDRIPNGVTVKPMLYEELLTPKQHELTIVKVTTCFEDSALHLTDRRLWLQLKPKPEQWASTRQVIQHWDTTIGACCKADLPEHEFTELEKAVLFGDAMNTQILNILRHSILE